MKRNYPPTKWSETATIWEQLESVKREIREFEEAMATRDTDSGTIELHDIAHSVSTLVDVYQRETGIDVDSKLLEVIDKNKARGYYLPCAGGCGDIGIHKEDGKWYCSDCLRKKIMGVE